MDIRKYEVLLAAMEEGSFSRASERLGYTQSGITHMMNSLEEEMGFPLLVRGNKGVYLTDEGKRLLPYIRELLGANERLNQECALIQGIERGSVGIGSFTSISIHWLPAIIERYQQLYPNIRLSLLEEGGSDELENWLAEGRIDVAFYSLRPNNSRFDYIELKEDPMYAILPKGHPMENCDVFPVEAAENEPFLAYRSVSGYDADFRDILDRFKVKPKILFSSNFDQFIISMVSHNQGISFLPELILRDWADSVVVKPLSPPVSRTLGIAVRSLKDASPAVKKLIEVTRWVLDEMEHPQPLL